MSGATITVSGPALRRDELSVVTDAGGNYYVSPVPAGRYEVEVRLAGFGSQVQREVPVAVNQEVTLDFVLRVAEMAATIQVTSGPSLVEVSRSYLDSRILTETIETLPLNGRNFVDLIGLVAGAKPEPAGERGTNISIFGERGAAVSYLVDGGDNNDPLAGGEFQRFTQDSIQEFEVMTTGYEAEFGRAQGGVVNIITRSGTNRWYGTGLLFLRDDSLDASNVSNQDVPQLQREQWGGSFGGPMMRDRAFIFGSLEVLDETRGVNIDRSKIPEFLVDGLGTPSGREDFGTGPGTDDYTALAKLDYSLDGDNQLNIMFNRNREKIGGEINSPIAGTVALPSAERGQERVSNSFSLREQWTIASTTFLETKGKYIDGQEGTNLDRGQRLEPILHLLRSGFLQTNAPFGGKRRRDVGRFQAGQNLSHFQSSRGGDHLLKVGWDWNHVTLMGFNEVTNDVEYSAAFLAPNQAEIMQEMFERYGFQQAAARFFTLSGNPNGSLDLDMANHDMALFLQDKWRVRNDLTLDLGVRYDYASLFSVDKNNISPRLGFAWDLAGRHQTVVRGGFGIFFDRNLLAAAATVPELGGVFTRSLFDVALPRLGSTYTDSLIDLVITSGFPDGEGGRTPAENAIYTPFAQALRENPLALYDLLGISGADSSDPPVITADNIQELTGMSPLQAIRLLESTYPGTDWEFWDVPGGSVVGNRVLSFFPRGPMNLTRDVSRFSKAKTPWTRAFNIGLEKEISKNMVLSVDFVHRRSRDLLTRRIVNLFDVPSGDPNFGKTIDGGPRISQVTYQGRVDYDGLVLQLRKGLSSRSSINVSYTASRARDNLLTGNVGSGFANNNHPELDYGPSNQSVPHLFSAHGLTRLPYDVNLSAIIYWRTGDAFNPRGVTDEDGDGLVDQRDTSMDRNSFRTQTFFNVDLRLEKAFQITESQALGLMVEAFNLTNRANVRNVNAVSGPSFGVPNNFFPGREIQIGLRYTFGGGG